MKKFLALFLCTYMTLGIASLSLSSQTGTSTKTQGQKGEKEEKQTVKKDKSLSLTMFIPGIYQFRKRSYLKGVIFLGAFAGCVAGTIGYNERGNYWYGKYSNATNVSDVVRYRKLTEDRFKTRNLFIAGIFTVWLAHLLDVKLFKSSKTGVTGNAGKDHVSLGFYHSF